MCGCKCISYRNEPKRPRLKDGPIGYGTLFYSRIVPSNPASGHRCSVGKNTFRTLSSPRRNLRKLSFVVKYLNSLETHLIFHGCDRGDYPDQKKQHLV